MKKGSRIVQRQKLRIKWCDKLRMRTSNFVAGTSLAIAAIVSMASKENPPGNESAGKESLGQARNQAEIGYINTYKVRTTLIPCLYYNLRAWTGTL